MKAMAHVLERATKLGIGDAARAGRATPRRVEDNVSPSICRNIIKVYNAKIYRHGDFISFKAVSMCKQWGSTTSPTAMGTSSHGGFGEERFPQAKATLMEAQNESEWLKMKLKQWLDDEYCPEPANDDISERCKKVYYRCLMEGVEDMGDILVEFIRDLESFDFRESFHGPFTAANAAIALIMEKKNKADEEQ